MKVLHRNILCQNVIAALICLFLIVAVCYSLRPATLFAQRQMRDQAPELVTQHFHYRIDAAGEVFLVWGINGWLPVPEQIRPAGSLFRKNLTYTPMTQKDGLFIAEVRVPRGTIIDYAFQITKTRDGNAINVWDANGEPKRDYHKYATGGSPIEIHASQLVLDRVNPGAVDWAMIWYIAGGGCGVVVICGILMLRRRFRNPYLDF